MDHSNTRKLLPSLSKYDFSPKRGKTISTSQLPKRIKNKLTKSNSKNILVQGKTQKIKESHIQSIVAKFEKELPTPVQLSKNQMTGNTEPPTVAPSIKYFNASFKETHSNATIGQTQYNINIIQQMNNTQRAGAAGLLSHASGSLHHDPSNMNNIFMQDPLQNSYYTKPQSSEMRRIHNKPNIINQKRDQMMS